LSWLKRNWVDALMGVLIVAVVGGVLALLFRGGPGQPAATPSPAQPAVSQSAPPPAPLSAPPAAPSPKPVEIPQIPSIEPASAAPSSPAASPSSAPLAASAPTNTAARPTVSSAPPSATASTTAPREPLTYTRADFLRNYRVALGTYSSATRAGSNAARLRALGYPAQAFSTSGNAYIVVAGPYAREAAARAAYNKLRAQGYRDAVLYKPSGERESAVATTKPPTPSSPTPAPPPASSPGASPAVLDEGLAYLQVGAFKNTQSALPMLNKLKGSGFKTLLRSAADGFTRVLVGPFDLGRITAARQNLLEQGYSAFAVKE
jgi:cell division protein FtsN